MFLFCKKEILFLLFEQLCKCSARSWNFVKSPGKVLEKSWNFDGKRPGKSEKKSWKVLEFESIFSVGTMYYLLLFVQLLMAISEAFVWELRF